jgi:hypothetical protein
VVAVTRATTHIHNWGRTVVVDRCHTADEEQTCRECGDVRVDPVPRDFSDPGAVAFADPNCPTCRKAVMQAGVWPDAWGAQEER